MDISLSSEERLTAQALWSSLMYAKSQARLEEARAALRVAPDSVRSAVTSAIVSHWSKGESEIMMDNPFE